MNNQRVTPHAQYPG